MKKQTPAQLVKIAQNHDAKALDKRAKADEITHRRQALDAKIAELTRKSAALAYRAQMLNVSANEHEAASSDLLNEARLDYTAAVEGASEDKAAAWEVFYRGALASSL
jgi:hypothetical protein